MDYTEMALELLKNRIDFLQVPANQEISSLIKGEFFVLNYLITHDNQAYPKNLYRKMAVSSARIAALLNHMEEKQLVIRHEDVKDNRQVIVSLTEKGMELIKKRRAEVLQDIVQLLEYLGPEDAENYLRIQKKIVRGFAKHPY